MYTVIYVYSFHYARLIAAKRTDYNIRMCMCVCVCTFIYGYCCFDKPPLHCLSLPAVPPLCNEN